MDAIRKSSLTREFALWSAGLALVTVLLMGSLVYVTARVHVRTDIERQLLDDQRAIGERLDDRITVLLENSASFAATPLFRDALVDTRTRERHLQPFLEVVAIAGELAVTLIVVDSAGVRLAGNQPGTPAGSLSGRAWLGEVTKAGKPHSGISGGRPATLEVAQPIVPTATDRAGGALVVQVALQELADAWPGPLPPGDSLEFRVRGEVLAHTGAPIAERSRFLFADGALHTVPEVTLVLGRQRAIALASLGELTAATLIAGLSVVILVFATALLLARKITRPVVELAAQARAITSAAALKDVRIGIEADNEIGELAAALDDMLRRVQSLYLDLERRVAQRTQALDALRESEDRFRSFLENAPAAIFLKDRDSHYTLVNRRFHEWYGYSPEEALGRSARDLFPRAEAELYIDFDREVLAGGGPLSRETSITTASGALLHIAITKFPVRDVHGTVVGVGTINLDISARKRAEDELLRVNENLERRVRERTAELLAANSDLEAFSYTVSHDLRAPLRALDGFSQALIEDCGDELSEKATNYLGFIQKGSHEMSRMLDGLLQLARSTRGELRRETVDLSGLALSIVRRLREESPGRTVEVEIPDGLTLSGDARLLRVALGNLLHNAWKYTGQTAHARIRMSGYREGKFDVVAVEDNGAGFDPAFADKLFVPFQRLHAEHEFEGTGIGLATVMRIVERHGGRVRAQGKPGHGALFAIALPGQARTRVRGRRAPEAPGAGP